MHHTLRTVSIASLSLILFTGLTVPTIGEAATTTQTTSTKATNGTVAIDAVNLPYNVIINQQGELQKVPWYPSESSQNLSATTINGSGFSSTFQTDNKADSVAQLVPGFLTDLTRSPMALTDNETFGQYLLASGKYDKHPSEDQLIAGLQGEYAFFSWLFKVTAQYDQGTKIFSEIQSEYNDSARDNLAKAAELSSDNSLSTYDGFFKNEENFKRSENSIASQLSIYHMTQYSSEELTKLVPDGAAQAIATALKTPMADMITNTDAGNTTINGLVPASQAFMGFFAFSEPKSTTTTIPSTSNTATTSASAPVTVHYVDRAGNQLKPTKTLTGTLGKDYQSEALTIPGYTLTKTPTNAAGTFSTTAQSVTYVYDTDSANTAADKLAAKKTVVYGIKKIGLYSKPTFSTKTRQTWYAKKGRINRPMFKVIGYTTSKNGINRYKVKDLNHQGTTGYITTKAAYVLPVYYATKHNTMTVINPKGVNAYSRKNLTGKVNHYKQGKVLKVTNIVHHNLTTRFVLSNGTYISANKKLVIAGKYTMPKRVQAKTAVNRYGTANLTNRNRHYPKKAHATFTVKGWAYSNANNFRKGDTLRYKVAGGYITGNKQFVRVIH
ncbi:DUF5776 domain-containing protein [Levilactobacillus mulengensis]|uniref:DUF5776 domain-containing protein n=1 Tax=Levilactobacillus mulengensis TaxID=2486025 RepID=UPI000F7962E5|nr:DUF5776 domain-containing protein [Levilactobacillus mulengensis]